MLTTYNCDLQTMLTFILYEDYMGNCQFIENQSKSTLSIIDYSIYALSPIEIENQEPIILTKITYKENSLNLKTNLYLIYYIEDELYVIENKFINIKSYGESIDKALISFQEDFISLWEEIGLENKEFLSPKACELKDKLSEIVFQSN